MNAHLLNRTSLAAIVVSAAALLAACGAAEEPAPLASSPEAASLPRYTPPPAGVEPAHTLVAFGDSWSHGAHCGGCVPFPELYAIGLQDASGEPVEFVNLTENGGTSDSLLALMRSSASVRASIAEADVVLINTGANDMEGAFAAYSRGECGGADELDCFREVAAGWRTNFDAMLTEIAGLRDGRPTALRLVANANEFLADPFLIRAFGREFGATGGAEITAMHHDANCAAAADHGAVCVDLRPVLNGPGLDEPMDVNSQEAMRRIADELLASGLAELDGIE